MKYLRVNHPNLYFGTYVRPEETIFKSVHECPFLAYKLQTGKKH